LREGISVGRRRVRRLLRKLGLWAVRPKRNTSKRHPEHKVYPYLLRGKTIDQPNQVWAADITYLAMQQGFLYLVAIIDWATRRVLSWRLSNLIIHWDTSSNPNWLVESICTVGKSSSSRMRVIVPLRDNPVYHDEPPLMAHTIFAAIGSVSRCQHSFVMRPIHFVEQRRAAGRIAGGNYLRTFRAAVG
jgi:hypothetical protein